MYVQRTELERKLNRAVNGTQNIIVFGDSGSGKTWLYKEFFEKHRVAYRTVDLAVALTDGLDSALDKSLPHEEWVEVKKTEAADVDGNFVIARAKEGRQIEYEKRQAAAVERVLNSLRDEKRAEFRFLVFDNFEQISKNQKIIDQVGSLIIQLDNEAFSRFGVRLFFVGVVSDMKELIARRDNAGTISNRLTEIPEVERLTIAEANRLINRGLVEKLKIEFAIPVEDVIERVRFLTDRNAQQIHEFCYQIACEASENDWRIDSANLDRAQNDWVDTSLSQHIAMVETRMNKRETKIQRRNQVLFCLGANETNSIRATQIDAMVRKFFPDKVSADQLGIDQILAGLAEKPNPIIVRNPNENSYRLSNPKLKLAIRARLNDLAPRKRTTISDLTEALQEIFEEIGDMKVQIRIDDE